MWAAQWSLSARRAWIEITAASDLHLHDRVALRKESVDRNMGGETLYMDTRMSLSARRAWIEIIAGQGAVDNGYVALRKESVDRNSMVRPP